MAPLKLQRRKRDELIQVRDCDGTAKFAVDAATASRLLNCGVVEPIGRPVKYLRLTDAALMKFGLHDAAWRSLRNPGNTRRPRNHGNEFFAPDWVVEHRPLPSGGRRAQFASCPPSKLNRFDRIYGIGEFPSPNTVMNAVSAPASGAGIGTVPLDPLLTPAEAAD